MATTTIAAVVGVSRDTRRRRLFCGLLHVQHHHRGGGLSHREGDTLRLFAETHFQLIIITIVLLLLLSQILQRHRRASVTASTQRRPQTDGLTR